MATRRLPATPILLFNNHYFIKRVYININVRVKRWSRNIQMFKYSGTSLLRSPTVLGKSDLTGEVTLLRGYLHCGIQFGTEPL